MIGIGLLTAGLVLLIAGGIILMIVITKSNNVSLIPYSGPSEWLVFHQGHWIQNFAPCH